MAKGREKPNEKDVLGNDFYLYLELEKIQLLLNYIETIKKIVYFSIEIYFIILLLFICNSTKLFSNRLTKGTIIKKCEKYNIVLI